MRRVAVLLVAFALCVCGCSTGSRVDLGDEASGNLIAAIAGEPDQLDPQKTSAYFSFEVLENVFDTLVEPDDNLQMRPALAESWDLSPDQLNWTFHLRKVSPFTTAARSRRTTSPIRTTASSMKSSPTPTDSAPSRPSTRSTRRR